MAYQPTDPYRAPLSEDEIAPSGAAEQSRQRDPARSDARREGGPSGAKVAMFAVAIAVVLGALFYGLNNTSVNQASTEPSARTAQTQPANPAAPPGMRDVTPKANSEPGTTTGAAPARPAAPQPTTPQTDNPASRTECSRVTRGRNAVHAYAREIGTLRRGAHTRPRRASLSS